MVILAQCFAMFPVCGITGSTYRSLYFKWKSGRTFYSIVYLSLLLVNISFHMYRICTTAITFSYIGKTEKFISFLIIMLCLFAVTLLYFACGVITGCLFLRLAKEWPYIMQKWTEIDVAMESYGFPTNLRRHLKIVAISIMTAAACELNYIYI